MDGDTIGNLCDSDEDGDGVNSAEDAFRFNPSYSSDADADGMPDAFELMRKIKANIADN